MYLTQMKNYIWVSVRAICYSTKLMIAVLTCIDIVDWIGLKKYHTPSILSQLKELCKFRGKTYLNIFIDTFSCTSKTENANMSDLKFPNNHTWNFLILPCKLRMIFPKKRDAAQKKSKMDFYYKIILFVIKFEA